MLLIYDNATNRKKMKTHYKEYRFVSFAYFLQESDNIYAIKNELEEKEIDHTIVDMSNVVKDGNLSRLYVERLMWVLLNNISDLHFCIQKQYLETFLDWIPDFFDEDAINESFTEKARDEGKNDAEKENVMLTCNHIQTKDIYVYNNIQWVEGTDKKVLSIGELINQYEGIAIQYNIEQVSLKLNEEVVDYIDISTLIRAVAIRNDLALQTEIFLLQLLTVYKNDFCISNDCYYTVEEKFPYLFAQAIVVDKLNNENQEETGDLPLKDEAEAIKKAADDINAKLKGHDDFKKDFKQNLLKYSFLYKMGERKIFSIMICGESGIGKTEFAKIISDRLYPKDDLIKINFGNYSTEGVLNSLIGSPLGYIGSEEGGELINKINRSHSKVILIDEFEKATASVYNFFYELLEDGIFTDRHGEKHNLNGYIIVFTSNMQQDNYKKRIPDSLKSRFDMVYYFVDIPKSEKEEFIRDSASALIVKIQEHFGKEVKYENIQTELNKLIIQNNLRDIKRKVEDIVFQEFFKML